MNNINLSPIEERPISEVADHCDLSTPTSIKNERNDATYAFDDEMRNSSDEDWQFINKVEEEDTDDDRQFINKAEEEDTYDDRQFINKVEEEDTDDDSIEVIERETSAPSSTFSSDAEYEESENEETEDEESENEEDENFKDLKNDLDEIVAENNQLQTITPVQPCQTCALSLRESHHRTEPTNGITWKVLYSFTLGVFASLIVHHYHECIPEKLFSFRLGNDLSIADMYSSYFPFPRTNSLEEELSSLKLSNAQEKDEDFLDRMKSYIESQRRIADGIFSKQLHLLESVRRVSSDVYVFNVSKLTQETTSEADVISKIRIDKPVTECDDNITSEQLPLVCTDNHDILVFVKESRLMSMYDAIQQFSNNTEKRANHFHEHLMSTLAETGDENTNSFVPDNDHFSKRYKPNEPCAEKTRQCEEESTSKVSKLVDDRRQINESAESEAVENEAEKPISGEWFMKLYRARAEVRALYNNMMKGDWMFKLGRAREEKRSENENKYRRDTEDNGEKKHYHWFKKASERVERNFKTYYTKAKVQLKKVRVAIADRIKEFKTDFKKRYRQFKNRFHDL